MAAETHGSAHSRGKGTMHGRLGWQGGWALVWDRVEGFFLEACHHGMCGFGGVFYRNPYELTQTRVRAAPGGMCGRLGVSGTIVKRGHLQPLCGFAEAALSRRGATRLRQPATQTRRLLLLSLSLSLIFIIRVSLSLFLSRCS